MSKLRIMRKTIRPPVWTILGEKELEKLPSITHKHWVVVSCLALGALRKEPLGGSQLNPENHWFLEGSLEEKTVLVRGWKTVPHEGGWRNREEITLKVCQVGKGLVLGLPVGTEGHRESFGLLPCWRKDLWICLKMERLSLEIVCSPIGGIMEERMDEPWMMRQTLG